MRGDRAESIINSYISKKGLSSIVESPRYKDLQIAKEWCLTIAQWDNLTLPEREEYRRYARAENRKEMFKIAYDDYVNPDK